MYSNVVEELRVAGRFSHGGDMIVNRPSVCFRNPLQNFVVFQSEIKGMK